MQADPHGRARRARRSRCRAARPRAIPDDSKSRVATIDVAPRPSVPQAIIVPSPRPGAPGTSVGPIGIADTMANSKPRKNVPSNSNPGTIESPSAARASPDGAMIAAPSITLRSLPQRSVRAADVVEASSSRPPMPNVTTTRPNVSTPNSSSNHGPNVTNNDCAVDISANTAATANHPRSGMRRRTIGLPSRSTSPARGRTASAPSPRSRTAVTADIPSTAAPPTKYPQRQDDTAVTRPSTLTPTSSPSAHDVSTSPTTRPRRS